VLALVSASGFTGTAFCFRGFFPRKEGERTHERTLAVDASRAGLCELFFWFESPQRILDALASWISPEVPAGMRLCVGKELTKLHERIWSGPSQQVLDEVREHLAREGERGEWVFGIQLILEKKSGSQGDFSENTAENSNWPKALQCLLDAQVGAAEAAKKVSQYFGVARNEAYVRALELTGKKSGKKF
jgi:16S rRNA (cytidine1402-2'-O)-methyltransferase